MSRSILLLGGSRQQVVAIEAARRLGYRTVLCDYLPDNPGRLRADAFYPASTTDRDAVLAIARDERVEGVLAYASDPAAPTAGYVAETLGLPGNPLRSIEVLSEKHLFRKHLREHSFACPRTAEIPAGASPAEAEELVGGLSLPVVVKPTDSSGSKGVSVLASLDGLEGALAAAASRSRNGVLIAEEYIEPGFPHVVGGDVFVVDGRVRFWGLMSCLRDEAGGGLVPVGEKAPSGLSSAQLADVKREIQRLVDSLGIASGELNVELIVGRDGSVGFLELGARAGGNMIPLQLSDASGIDLVAANVLCAMGEDPGAIDFDGEGPCLATYVLHSNVDGVFRGVELSDEMAPHVYRTVMYARPGDEARAFDGADKALGVLFLRFDGERQMSGLLEAVGGHVRAVVS